MSMGLWYKLGWTRLHAVNHVLAIIMFVFEQLSTNLAILSGFVLR